MYNVAKRRRRMLVEEPVNILRLASDTHAVAAHQTAGDVPTG